MPPSASQSHGITTTILNTIANKEEGYREGVRTNHQLCTQIAERLTTGGGMKETLMALNRGSSDEEPILPEEELLTFFEEHSTRLKALAERNAERSQKIDAFSNVIKSLQQQNVAMDYNGEYKEGQFEKIIDDAMLKEAEKRDARGEDVKNSDIYKAICKSLGEKDTSDENDDDDIEVVRNDKDNDFKCKW